MRWTRSRGVFESDVLLTEVRDAARRRSPFALCPVTGALESVRVVRGKSGVSESECQVRVRMPDTRALAKAVVAAHTTGACVKVVAYGPQPRAMYDRGRFVIRDVGLKFMTLEKVWTDKSATEKNASTKEPEKHTAPVSKNKIMVPLGLPVRSAPQTVALKTQFYARPVLLSAPPTVRARQSSTIVRAIRTDYKGIEYRSRLEARFAQLLDALHVRYVYEPMRLNQTTGGTYTIDFFLPAQQLYVELKPKRPHIEEEAKCERMSRSGFRVALLYGSCVTKMPFRSELFKGRSHRDYVHHDALRGMAWVDGTKLPGDTVFVRGASSSPLGLGVSPDSTYLDQVVTTDDTRWNDPAIQAAMRALYI